MRMTKDRSDFPRGKYWQGLYSTVLYSYLVRTYLYWYRTQYRTWYVPSTAVQYYQVTVGRLFHYLVQYKYTALPPVPNRG